MSLALMDILEFSSVIFLFLKKLSVKFLMINLLISKPQAYPRLLIWNEQQ